MPRFLPDTSCLGAAVCAWHVHHRNAAQEIERRLATGETMVMAAPALVEAYSILTHLPPPHRLSPAEGLALLETNFLGQTVEVAALEADPCRAFLRSAPDQGIAGGRIYVAGIVACGLTARVATILTFNERQFRSLAIQASR